MFLTVIKILGNTFNISHCFCSIGEFNHDLKIGKETMLFSFLSLLNNL